MKSLNPFAKVLETKERAHSKFSASGAERWFVCPGSVALSEGVPDKSSPWAEEGTQAHDVLERILRNGSSKALITKEPAAMIAHGVNAATFIWSIHQRASKADLMVEDRVFLDFIHKEAFGTLDSAVIEHFGTLHVFDYKYGAGHGVSPKENLQMIFYALAMAHKHHWNFKRVRLWIIQPRIKGYDGPVFWDISLEQLRAYVPKFQAAIDRVEAEPDTYVEGGHCHWCKAKGKCPLKVDKHNEKATQVFGSVRKENNGKEESKKESSKAQEQKSEADWRKEKARRKSRTRKRKIY